MGILEERRKQAKQEARDRRLKNSKTSLSEIHHRWPYEVWLRKTGRNPNGLYVLKGREVSEEEAEECARRLQRVEQRKALVFYHPEPEQSRVLVWNDLKFNCEQAADDERQ